MLFHFNSYLCQGRRSRGGWWGLSPPTVGTGGAEVSFSPPTFNFFNVKFSHYLFERNFFQVSTYIQVQLLAYNYAIKSNLYYVYRKTIYFNLQHYRWCILCMHK